MLEEWTAVAKRLFRLDLIDSYSGTRRTLLSNKYTNENFYYKPFECSLVSNFDSAYFPELADKFRSNFDLLVPTGVGSLWLQSSDIDASYLVSSYNDSSKIPVKTSNHVLKNYIQYKVPISENGYPYRVDFFFRPGDESLQSLALIHILKLINDGKSAKVSMRIKILEIETFKESIDSLSDFEGLFDLPVGYGCQRGEFYDRSFAIPVNRFMPNYVPHVLQLDIVSTQLIDSYHDTDKWKNHEVSVRIVTGRLKTNTPQSNDYIILETQDFALRSPTDSKNDIRETTATLRRRKRVWDLGKDGLTSKDSEKRSKFFEIDERTRQCLSFGENKLSESASIEFGISSKENSVATPSTLSNSDTQAKVILSLNTELIDILFTSTQDYHLIRENRLQTYPHTRETLYERRVNKFQLKDSKGNVVWSGPVSFIRKHSTRLKSDMMHQTSSIMYFYSNDLTKLVGKIHMVVIERRTISEAYLHRELEDIGKLCFAKMLSSGTNDKLKSYYKEKPDYDGILDFVLSYPIDESKDTAEKLSMVDSIDEVLYKEFIATMFAVSNGRLNFLQLSDIDIDFGPEMIKISAEISEMPSLLNYWQDYGQKFSESKKSLLFSEKNILNEELCAKSCLYYNCFMFSYCSNTKICDILLTKVENFSNNPKREGIVMTFEPDSSCSIFRPQINQDNSKDIKSFIKPNELIQNLQQTILSSKDEDENNVLKLELLYLSAKQEKVEINLTPMFITSGNFSSEEFGDLFDEETNKKKVSDSNGVKAEYKIVFENRKFKDTLKIGQEFPLQLAQHTSYDDCKLLCSETDCRSFSHCKIESTCRVSMLHKTKLIIDSSEEEDLCVISSRDYSSKFKQTLSDKHILKLRNVSKTLIAGSENDCAIDCMEEEKFKCKSFYYCPRQQQGEEKEEEGEEGDEFNCYLRKTHLAVENKLPAINKTIFQASQRKCYLYTRKYKHIRLYLSK